MREDRYRRRLIRLVGLGAVALVVPLVVTGPAAVAWAASDGGSSIEPVQLQAAPLRSAFTYELGPEKHVADAVVVKNSTATSQTFELYAADGYDTADSDVFALRSATQPKLEVGAWVHLPSASVTVPAHSSIRVPFSLSVPAHVSPGDHMGGIVALDEEPTAVTGNGSHLLVRTGVGVRILVRVPGRLRPGLSVTAVRVSGSVPPLSFLSGSSRATVRVGLANTGNTVLSGVLHVAATDSFGRTVARLAPVRFDALLPGARATLVVPPWKHLPVLGPTIGVHVKVDANMTTASAVARFHDVPWVLLAVVLAGVLALGAAVSRVQRRRRATARTTSQSDHVDDTANPGVPVVVATIDRSLLVCEVNPRRAGHSRRRRPSTCGRPDRRKKHGDGTGCAGTQAQGPGGLSATAPTRRHPRRGPSRRPARRSTGMRRRSVQTARRMPLRSKKVLAPLLIALAIVVPMAIFVSDASAATVTWTLIASPDQSAGSPPAATANTLTDLAAVSANDVWAVGSYNAGTSSAPLAQTLVEHYDGTSWSVVSSPNQLNVNNAVTSNELLAVSADSADDVWAVGTYEDLDSSDNPIAQTLVEHYDGTSWSVVSSPDDSAGSPPAPTDNTLSGIVALSAADVWAVGSYNAGTSSAPIAQTLVEHYDGTSWSVVASADASSAQDNALAQVAAVSSGDLWAVGSANFVSGTQTVSQTLIEGTPASSTTTITASANPSVVGQQVVLTATVAGSSTFVPGGNVSFTDDGTPIEGCSEVTLAAGIATCDDVFANPATHAISVSYGGDDNFLPSGASFSQTVDQAATTTTVTVSPTSAVVGQSLTLAATVAPSAPGAGTPTGAVSFLDDDAPISGCQSVTLSSDMAACATAVDTAATHTLSAVYGGDANFTTSTSSGLPLNVAADATTTSLSSSADPSLAGEPVTYVATVVPAAPGGGTPTGSVAFEDSTTVIAGCGAAALSSGVATCNTIYTLDAAHTITAVYTGSADYVGSTSPALTQTVGSGALSLSDNTGSSFAVDLSPVTFASAQFLAATGQLNTVQVNDNRGTEGGWSVTAQLESNFTNSQPSGAPADNTIPADFLTWVPDVPTAIDGASLSGVSAGNTSTLSDTTAVALCSAVQGSGGSGYNCGASLSLSVPPYVATGTYFATLDIVVTSN